MAAPFPDHPMLRGVFAPVFVEGESSELPVLGEVPLDLRGTLYRNGPNPQFAPRGHYHWFTGDGMVHAFRLEDGRVTYRNRWMRTPRFELERAAGRALFGAFGNPAETDPAARGTDFGVANTHVVHHAGHLLALEESHLLFAFDPVTLESCGYHDFGGALPRTLKGRFTAHPKVDPSTGEMVGYSYSGSGLFGTRMSLIVVGPDGALTRREFFDAPYCAFVHDFLLTERHVVFRVLPVVGNMAGARRGPSLRLGGGAAGLPRRRRTRCSDGDYALVRGGALFVFHAFNAPSDGDKIFCDVMRNRRPSVFPDPDGRMPPPSIGMPLPVRWTLDLGAATDVVRSETLSERPGEFPRCD
jgi:carotenoid cleavage dioxygenase-like enzyme